MPHLLTCLLVAQIAMENGVFSNYVTEKLVNAFVGGAVPIYRGSSHALDIFNREAMILWDPTDHTAALTLIRQLNGNHTAWAAMVTRPVLKDGERTLQEYFSVADSVGGGMLKERIRRMVAGLEDTEQ